jgi:cell division protein FtsQ
VTKGTHAQRRSPRSRRSGWLLGVGAALVVLVAAAGGADAALHSRLFAASHVTVTGARHEPAAAVVHVAGLAGSPAMLSVDPGTIAARVETAFPWVLHAQVTVSWPHSVSIAITERRAVAEVRNKTGHLELVDLTGRRLGPPGRNEALPIIEVPTDSVALATAPGVLPAAAAPGLIVASTLPAAFKWQVAVVNVNAQGWVTLELSSPVSFVLGPADQLGAKYEDVASVIASTTMHAGDVIDVSVPQAMTVTGP